MKPPPEAMEALFMLMRMQFISLLLKMNSATDYLDEPNRMLAARLMTGEVAEMRDQLEKVSKVLDRILMEQQ